MWTRQTAFNKVWEHFVTNKAPPSMHGAYCVYRGPEGRKCAIGVLMDDADYKPRFDSRISEAMILDKVMDLCPSLAGLDKEFANELQGAHDRYADSVLFHAKIHADLTVLASEYDLTIPQ